MNGVPPSLAHSHKLTTGRSPKEGIYVRDTSTKLLDALSWKREAGHVSGVREFPLSYIYSINHPSRLIATCSGHGSGCIESISER